MEFLLALGSFIVALAILISVHEFGHFWVARRLGVKVLRFSIGFGRPLLSRQRSPDDTEYVLAAIPFGGYVKMLDEREVHRAFNRQPLRSRVAIVAAGPAFNLLFAILVYWALFISGDTGLRPMIGAVEPDSIASQSGFEVGDELIRIGNRDARTWEMAVFAFMAEAMDGGDMDVRVRDASGNEIGRRIVGEAVATLPEQPDILDRLGLSPKRPVLPAVIGELVAGDPAEQAGLLLGDRITAVDGAPVADWSAWVAMVREHPDKALAVEILRDGSPATLSITPRGLETPNGTVGRIGAGVLSPDDLMDDYRVDIRYGPLDALYRAGAKTLDMSALMLRVMGRMLIGQASMENLSGPITIAETAGRTASYGLESFVKFLAVVSISLGVLNLLPIPILDGGHLLFFLIEWVKGSPLSEHAQMQGQKVGMILLAALMTLAFYVDLSRLLG